MKILQVITSLQIGGAEKLVVDMVPLMKKEGHTVDVLVFNGMYTSFKKQLQAQGIRIFSLGYNNSVYNPKFIFQLIPIIKRYDIVHTHNTACQYYVALAKFLSNSRVKLITTEHSTSNRRRNNRLFKYIDRFIYAQYDILVAISEKAGNLLSKYLSGKKVELVLNGVNVSSFQHASRIDRKSIGIEDQKVLITMVARFAEAKDQKTLIRAMALLPPTYVLLLIGEGNMQIKKQCEQLAASLGLGEKVIFGGIRNDIPNILKASDIIVMSSHWEGLSLSSIEGMSVGKPFVASDVNGLQEITKNAGILFPHEDAKALADIIAENLKDNNIMYQNFNSTNFTADVMNIMFPSSIAESSPVCIMIKEFNTAVDNSALSHADNAGVFDPSFDSNNYNPCNITVN